MSKGLPLAGLRVIELGHFIAGPFAARIMADMGAEVIKVEPPQAGDPARDWGVQGDGCSLWWSVHARNKKCITADLKSAAGRDLILRLVAEADAVIENYRPGQLERWGLGPDELRAVNPECIVVRISGYGQDGPYRDKVSFGVVGEAVGGIRHLSGFPEGMTDLPPARAGISLGDSVAALYGVIGLLSALYERGRTDGASGRTIDVALHEAVFSLLEGSLPEYGKRGIVRQPSGATLPTTAPSNAYRCADGRWIIIAGNSDRIFARLMTLVGRADLGADSRFATNAGRVKDAAELDAAIGAWAIGRSAAEAQKELDRHEIPGTPIYTIQDIAEDPQYLARDMIREVNDPIQGTMLHPGAVPKFDGSAEAIRWTGPRLGQHNLEVLTEIAKLDEAQIRKLQAEGVI